MIVATVLLFMAGHCVRDGYPSFKTLTKGVLGTQAARVTGALLCALGAWLIGGPLYGVIVGAGILAGFYFDMKHGEGAGVDTPIAVFDSVLSGITSIIPLAFALGFWREDAYYALLPLLGLLKPLIWYAAWRTDMSAKWWFMEPTRVAAMAFGGVIGIAAGALA